MNLYESIKNNLSEAVITKDDLTADVKRDLNIEPGSDEEYELDNLYSLRDLDAWIEDLYAEGLTSDDIKRKFALDGIDVSYGLSPEELDAKVDSFNEADNKNSFEELLKIKDKLLNDDTDRLMLHTKNKKSGTLGNASFFTNGEDKIKVFEGKGDGSDDKELDFSTFISNYDYILSDESDKPFKESDNVDLYDFAHGSSTVDFIADGTYTYGQKIRFIADQLNESGNVDSYSDESYNDYLLNVAKILYKAADEIDALK